MENNKELESKKDISSKWLDVLFDSLLRLEFYDRNLKSGAQDLFEYLQTLRFKINPVLTLKLTQIKAVDLMISEFEILKSTKIHFSFDLLSSLSQRSFSN